jgi:putative ABC transport system permease protein
MELRVVGTTPAWFILVSRDIIAGRELLSEDQQDQAPVAVLTEHGARKLLATEHTIGQSIRIATNVFEVIGIVKSEGGMAGNIQIPDQKVDVYIPIEVAADYFGDITTRRTSGGREREKVEQRPCRIDCRRHHRNDGTFSQEEGL